MNGETRKISLYTEADPEILKRGGAFYVGHHGWTTKKILGLRWFEKAKITLETISFWRNISISIFKFSQIFIYNESLPMKSYQFFKIYKHLVRKEKKDSYSSQ